MDAGKLRHRILVQSPTRTVNAFGEPVISWTPAVAVCERSASVTPLSGVELERARQVQEEVTHQVVLRGDPETRTITPADRVVFEGRFLQIVSVLDRDERGIELTLLCKEHH